MRKTWKFLLAVVAVMVVLQVARVDAQAASYRTVQFEKTKIGNVYLWRPENNSFKIVKKNGKEKLLTEDCYTVFGVSNGKKLYYSTLSAKFSPSITVYQYSIKTGKKKRITEIKNGLHIQGYCDGKLYVPKRNQKLYSYDLKTGKIKKIAAVKDAYQIIHFQNKKLYYRVGDTYHYGLAVFHAGTGKVTKLAEEVRFDYTISGNMLYYVDVSESNSWGASRCQVMCCNVETMKTDAVSPVFEASELQTLSVPGRYVEYTDPNGDWKVIYF